MLHLDEVEGEEEEKSVECGVEEQGKQIGACKGWRSKETEWQHRRRDTCFDNQESGESHHPERRRERNENARSVCFDEGKGDPGEGNGGENRAGPIKSAAHLFIAAFRDAPERDYQDGNRKG